MPLQRSAIASGLALVVAACSLNCPPEGFEREASHQDYVNMGSTGRQWLPTNEWVRNRGAEAFIGDAVRHGGTKALTAKYGMQCLPRSEVADCTDCYTCTKSYPGKGLRMTGFGPIPVPYTTCIDRGQMTVRAEIGPGAAVSVMSYHEVPKTPKQE